MTRPRYISLRKRRTREHVIADLAVNYVERQALLCGYAVERRQKDYGIDLEIITFDEHGELENGNLLVQVKATDHLQVVDGGRAIACRVDVKDVRAWLGEFMPVFLALYDSVGDVTYWIDIQRYYKHLQGRPKASTGRVTVRLPRENALTPDVIQRWSKLPRQRLRPMWRIISHDE